MYIVGLIINFALSLYTFVLLLRVVLDSIMLLSRDWHPKGLVLVLANTIYALTDPPVKFFGRLIPPLRLGGIALDMGFLVLFLIVALAQKLTYIVFF